jgi:hypothetical protein
MNTTNKNKLIAIIILSFLYSVAFWHAQKLFFYPVSVIIEMKSKASETCQLFYDTGKGFNGDESLIKHYDAHQDFRIISFKLPLAKIQNIRIDPTINSPKLIIKQITIKVGSDSITHFAPSIPSHFKLINLAPSDITKEAVILEQINSPDAQLILNPALNQIVEVEHFRARSIFYGVSIVLYLIILVVIILFGERIYATYTRWMQSLKSGAEMSLNTEIIIMYLKRNQFIIIFSFIVAIFAYGYELFNFSLSIDEEIDSFKTASEAYAFIIVGRWGVYFLNLFFQPISIIPYYPTIIALICLSLSSIVFTTQSKENLSSKIIFSIIFISNPIHSYYLSFNSSGLYYTMGLVLTTVAYFIFKHSVENEKRYFKNYFVTILLLGFSISLYQSHLILFIVYVVYFVFSESLAPSILKRKFIWQIIKDLIIIVSLSLIFYKIGDLITRHYFLPEILNNSTYLENFSKWGKLPLIHIFKTIFQEITNYLTGYGKLTSILGLSLKAIPFVFLLIVFKLINIKQSIPNRIISIILLLALTLSPFLLVFYSGGILPIRTMIPLTLMIALLWLISYKHSGFLLRRLIFIVAILILINNTWINTRLFYASYTSWQADRNIAERMIERIYQLDPPKTNGRIKVVFLGNYKHEQNELFFKSETHGASFFEWDPGKPYRINPFFKTNGISELYTVSLDLLKDYNAEIEAMPSWPDAGSIKLFDAIVLVKFSNSKISGLETNK